MPTATPLDTLRALCGARLPEAALVPALLEALHGVVPSARNLFDWTDDDGRLLRYYFEGPIDALLARLYFDEFHNRRETEAMLPFHALRDRPAGVCGAEDLDTAGFYRSALYHEIWKPQGLHSRLEAVLRGRCGRLLGSLVLYRGPQDPAFTRVDRQRLAQALPLLCRALEAGHGDLADSAGQPHLPAPEPAETLLLTPDGQACHASPGALRLLLMAEGGASRHTLQQAPHRLGGPLLGAVLHRLRQAPQDEAHVQHLGPGGHVVASARLLQPLSADAPPPAAPLVHLRLRRHEPHRVALERALRGLPLTAGQTAVCRALYQGLPQPRIGNLLGVAPSTVVDHVRKAYRALDLHSAAELRTLLDGRIARAAA